MTAWTGSALAALQSGQFARRWAVRFDVRPLGGGAVTTLAHWEGEADRAFNLDGTSRTYAGLGVPLQLEPVRYVMGTQIQTLDLRYPLTAAGETFVRGWDTRLAPAQVHCLIFDPLTEAFLGSRRYWKGFVDAVSLATGEIEGVTSATVRLASTARLGTLNAAGKKSDASQLARYPGDRFRRYGDLGTKPNDPWGVDK